MHQKQTARGAKQKHASFLVLALRNVAIWSTKLAAKTRGLRQRGRRWQSGRRWRTKTTPGARWWRQRWAQSRRGRSTGRIVERGRHDRREKGLQSVNRHGLNGTIDVEGEKFVSSRDDGEWPIIRPLQWETTSVMADIHCRCSVQRRWNIGGPVFMVLYRHWGAGPHGAL